jgi:hypothetical protein
MKQILTILIFISSISFAQNSGCLAPTSAIQFGQMKRGITNQVNYNQRLQTAINTVQGICMSVQQLAEIIAIFPQEQDKLDIAVYGINNLANGQDYYLLYDAFANFSTAIRLHDYVNQYFGPQQNVFLPAPIVIAPPIIQPPQPVQPIRPIDPVQPVQPVQPVTPIVPPVPVCEVTAQQFSMIRNTLAAQTSSSSKVSITKAQLPTFKCYTSSQMKEIVSLFPSSSDKLDIAKFGYDYVSDKSNYFFAVSSLLPSSSDREELSTYIAAKGR